MADGNQRFQRSLRQCLRFAVAWTLLMLVFIAAERWLAGLAAQAVPVSPALAVLLVLGMLAFMTLLGVAASGYYGLEVNPATLRVRSGSGSTVDIPWSTIEAVEFRSLGGLPVLRLWYSGAAKAAGVPLWLTDPAAFRSAATAYAGDRNPLVRWLIEHPRAGRFRFWGR